MADKKISALTALAQGDVVVSTDVLPIVDTSATETKKIAVNALVGAAAAAGLTNVDINSGTIDGTTIATSDITVGSGKTLNVSAGTLTLADNQISGDKVEGGTINAITINTLTSTAVNATTVDATNVEVTNIKAKDGTAAGSIADSTGVVTLASSVLTTTDINGGTIDGTAIGASSASTGAFSTLSASGNVTLSGGTANGVLYLNGSKVATSGSALTYNGTNLINTTGYVSASTDFRLGNATFSRVAIGDGGGGWVGGYSITYSGGVVHSDTGAISGVYYTNGGNIQFYAGPSASAGTAAPERMRLNTSGNLGLGTSSPSNRLDVFASADWQGRVVGNAGFNGGLIVEGNATGTRAQINLKTNNGTPREYYLRNVGGTFSLSDNTAGTIPFTVEAATPSNTIYANASGNVGIGTSSPSYKLDVQSSSVTNVARLQNGTGASLYFYCNGSAASNSGVFGESGGQNGLSIVSQSNYITLNTNNAERLRIDSAGNMGLGVTPSAWASNYRSLDFNHGSLSQGGTGAGSIIDLSYNAYYNGTNWLYKNTDEASQYRQAGGLHYWYTAASGTAGNTISFGDAKMTLDASGNLGVGITSPGYRLHVKSITGTIASLDGSGTTTGAEGTGASLLFTGNDGTFNRNWAEIGGFKENSTNQNYASYLSFSTRANGGSVTERARITSDGNFLVTATTAGGNGITLTGGTTTPAVGLVGSSSTAGNYGITMYSSGAAANRFLVDYAGTVFATNTTISAISDQRYKENIRDLDIGLNAIMALKPRKFDWKHGKGKDIKDDRGFIAQEFEQVFPDLVDEWADPAPEGEEPYKSVRQDLIPVLVKAMQEQQAMINELKAKVAALETK